MNETMRNSTERSKYINTIVNEIMKNEILYDYLMSAVKESLSLENRVDYNYCMHVVDYTIDSAFSNPNVVNLVLDTVASTPVAKSSKKRKNKKSKVLQTTSEDILKPSFSDTEPIAVVPTKPKQVLKKLNKHKIPEELLPAVPPPVDDNVVPPLSPTKSISPVQNKSTTVEDKLALLKQTIENNRIRNLTRVARSKENFNTTGTLSFTQNKFSNTNNNNPVNNGNTIDFTSTKEKVNQSQQQHLTHSRSGRAQPSPGPLDSHSCISLASTVDNNIRTADNVSLSGEDDAEEDDLFLSSVSQNKNTNTKNVKEKKDGKDGDDDKETAPFDPSVDGVADYLSAWEKKVTANMKIDRNVDSNNNRSVKENGVLSAPAGGGARYRGSHNDADDNDDDEEGEENVSRDSNLPTHKMYHHRHRQNNAVDSEVLRGSFDSSEFQHNDDDDDHRRADHGNDHEDDHSGESHASSTNMSCEFHNDDFSDGLIIKSNVPKVSLSSAVKSFGLGGGGGGKSGNTNTNKSSSNTNSGGAVNTSTSSLVFFDQNSFDNEVDYVQSGKADSVPYSARPTVRFADNIVSDTFYRDKITSPTQKAELFYNHEEEYQFTLDQNKEYLKADALGMTWNEWIQERTDEDVARDEAMEAAEEGENNHYHRDDYSRGRLFRYDNNNDDEHDEDDEDDGDALHSHMQSYKYGGYNGYDDDEHDNNNSNHNNDNEDDKYNFDLDLSKVKHSAGSSAVGNHNHNDSIVGAKSSPPTNIQYKHKFGGGDVDEDEDEDSDDGWGDNNDDDDNKKNNATSKFPVKSRNTSETNTDNNGNNDHDDFGVVFERSDADANADASVDADDSGSVIYTDDASASSNSDSDSDSDEDDDDDGDSSRRQNDVTVDSSVNSRDGFKTAYIAPSALKGVKEVSAGTTASGGNANKLKKERKKPSTVLSENEIDFEDEEAEFEALYQSGVLDYNEYEQSKNRDRDRDSASPLPPLAATAAAVVDSTRASASPKPTLQSPSKIGTNHRTEATSNQTESPNGIVPRKKKFNIHDFIVSPNELDHDSDHGDDNHVGEQRPSKDRTHAQNGIKDDKDESDNDDNFSEEFSVGQDLTEQSIYHEDDDDDDQDNENNNGRREVRGEGRVLGNGQGKGRVYSAFSSDDGDDDF